MSYIWDQAKAGKVFREHGIRFEDAVSVFDDVYSWMQKILYQGRDGVYSWMQKILYQGRDGVYEEQFRTVGLVGGRFITAVTREDDDGEKIITAWKSSREEIKGYFENLENIERI